MTQYFSAGFGGVLLVVLVLLLLAVFVQLDENKKKIVKNYTPLFISIALVIAISEFATKFEFEALTFLPLLFIGCFLVYKFVPKE